MSGTTLWFMLGVWLHSLASFLCRLGTAFDQPGGSISCSSGSCCSVGVAKLVGDLF